MTMSFLVFVMKRIKVPVTDGRAGIVGTEQHRQALHVQRLGLHPFCHFIPYDNEQVL